METYLRMPGTKTYKDQQDATSTHPSIFSEQNKEKKKKNESKKET